MWRTWLERTLARRNAEPARPDDDMDIHHGDTENTEVPSPREARSPSSVPSVPPW